MKRTTSLTIIFACIFFAGCVPQKMYYFGNYSETLYAFEKNQNGESLLKHKQELERVIAESKIKKLPVPPGICAELGYINLKSQKEQEAINLFETEARLYPESQHLMTRLIQRVKTKKDVQENQKTSSKGNGNVK